LLAGLLELALPVALRLILGGLDFSEHLRDMQQMKAATRGAHAGMVRIDDWPPDSLPGDFYLFSDACLWLAVPLFLLLVLRDRRRFAKAMPWLLTNLVVFGAIVVIRSSVFEVIGLLYRWLLWTMT